MVLQDGRHRKMAVQMLKDEGELCWNDGTCCMHDVMRQERALILKAEAIKLSKVATMHTAIVR